VERIPADSAAVEVGIRTDSAVALERRGLKGAARAAAVVGR
jgi:hypothetical protein